MILILGAGLSGLSAARALAAELPPEELLVLEREPEPGGVCRSHRERGFTFDRTGHYLHLKDPEIERDLLGLLGERLMRVFRNARIYSEGAWLDYPFQAHLHGLPREQVAQCLIDFIEASRRTPPEPGPKTSFEEWARGLFGDGIAEAFLLPYNRKLYRADLKQMTTEWVSWAVPRPSVEQVVRGALGVTNEGLGYNPSFYVPAAGGIDVIARTLAAELGSRIELGAEVVEVDAAAREVTLAGGRRIGYDGLISTLPLPDLLRRTRGLGSGLRPELAGRLQATAVVELQLGIPREAVGDGVHWIYVPEPRLPFYRVGIPSNVCPAMAPAGHSSLSVELSAPAGGPTPDAEALLAQVRPGLEELELLRPGEVPVLCRADRIDPAYVVFDPLRTPVVEQAQAALLAAGIRSIGRFGGWDYSSMETALREGIDAARGVLAET
jgi:protoporphyrinogen oxidase